MKMSKIINSAALLLILSVAATSAFANPQRSERVPPAGERYAYVWVSGSRIPQKLRISPSGRQPLMPCPFGIDVKSSNGPGYDRGGMVQDPFCSRDLGGAAGR